MCAESYCGCSSIAETPPRLGTLRIPQLTSSTRPVASSAEMNSDLFIFELQHNNIIIVYVCLLSDQHVSFARPFTLIPANVVYVTY